MSTDIGTALDALGDPTRRAILSRLAAGPVPVGEISRGLPVGRPAVSMHLRVLRDAGLVVGRSAGNRRYYQLNPDVLGQLRDYLDWYWTQALAAYRAAAEREDDKPPMSDAEPEVSVVKTITVEAGIVRAFEIFADHGRWWPVQTHHLAVPRRSRSGSPRRGPAGPGSSSSTGTWSGTQTKRNACARSSTGPTARRTYSPPTAPPSAAPRPPPPSAAPRP